MLSEAATRCVLWKKVLIEISQNSGLRPATFLKKETRAQVFSCDFCESSEITFFTEHLRATASVLLSDYERLHL